MPTAAPHPDRRSCRALRSPLAPGRTALALLLAGAASLSFAAIASAEDGTLVLGASEVEDAFGVGRPLVENSEFKVHASRRDGAGQAEVHERDTDILYVLGGSAELVTGGSVEGAKEISPGELRGSAISGGTPRPLAKGDVVVVPRGVPHWFREVGGDLVYYVVKVSDAAPRADLPSPSLGALGANPASIVDLATAEGARLVGASWGVADVAIEDVRHREPGPDLRASGAENRTDDVRPRGDDVSLAAAKWRAVAPEDLTARIGHGRLSFAWYRTRITLPERVGAMPVAGSAAVFEIVVDDYAEVWVNGKQAIALGQVGGPLAAGFNAPNRVLLASDARPGQSFDVAVFAANAPLSAPPANFLWVRSATLDFYPSAAAVVAEPVETRVDRRDSALDAIVAPGTSIERLAQGFQFTEGPVWAPDGYLLFSDPNANRIYRWTEDGAVSVFRTKSGYAGVDIARYHQPGSNGLAFDGEGRLVVCEHGRRRVVRIEKTGAVTVLADRYQGKRLNSPNDVTVRKNGDVCFTDPPFGLPAVFDDPAKEMATSGIYCVTPGGEPRLVSDELAGPNGIAFSPDEKFLYVANWDPARKVVMRYPVRGSGFGKGETFFDMTGATGEEALDGIEVDRRGNLFVSGPGGVWVLSRKGKHLGTIAGPELPANFALGGADGRTLFLAARTGLYRLRMAQ